MPSGASKPRLCFVDYTPGFVQGIIDEFLFWHAYTIFQMTGLPVLLKKTSAEGSRPILSIFCMRLFWLLQNGCTSIMHKSLTATRKWSQRVKVTGTFRIHAVQDLHGCSCHVVTADLMGYHCRFRIIGFSDK